MLSSKINLHLLLSILFFLIINKTNAQSSAIDSLKNIASIENKKILLYFSGSDWCAPCIKLKKTFVSQPNFQEFSKTHLLLLNADFPRKKANQLSGQKVKENELLAEKYNPNGTFPLIVVLDKNGKILKKWEGLPSESVTEFINELK